MGGPLMWLVFVELARVELPEDLWRLTPAIALAAKL